MKLPGSRNSQIAVILLLTMGVGLVDYLSGTEIRVSPFYFLPIALAASLIGRGFAFLISFVCTVLWVVCHAFGGMEFSSAWIWVWNAAAEASAFLLVAALVSQLQAAVVRERELARIDNLTGLLNPRAFHERAPALIGLCHRESTPLVIAYVDLDNFKNVNDTQGHQRGDEVLRIAAQIMQSNLRTTDLLARFGGDEFAVLLPNSSPEAAAETLERLRDSIERAMRSARCNVTASIGAVAYIHAPSNLEEVIVAADRVMYSVKNSGKNRVLVSTTAQ